MGKLGKQLKKRKLNAISQASTIIDNIIPSSDLEITLKTLIHLQNNPTLFIQKEYKNLRTILYQLHQSKGQTASGRVSDALKDGRFEEASIHLLEMRQLNQVPKLGALQRWVRDCDAASESDGKRSQVNVWRTLDAILRTTDPQLIGVGSSVIEPEHPLRMQPVWYPDNEPPRLSNEIPFALYEELKSKFSIIYKEQGIDRKPENAHDMVLYTCPANTIDTCQYDLTVSRMDVPNLPGAFVLRNVLSPQECFAMISAAESIGFTPDVPLGGSAKELNSVLAHNFFWLADTELVETIYERCKEFLPQEMGPGYAIAGLNARWRMYRYTPGSIYRPHIDGAWPGSGLKRNGEYEYDIYGDRWSKLTFLIRLNHGFKGGETTFFTPSMDQGYLDGKPVYPFQGDVLVFPHGDTQGSLLHEGSAVLDTKGECFDAKYVIRTEVLYILPTHQRKECD